MSKKVPRVPIIDDLKCKKRKKRKMSEHITSGAYNILPLDGCFN